jgi:N,N'-diacetylbacillosaminyl-diphospho-undecaprenol alpha-1,3-N-acetylgalactosaminyltransferase
MKVIMVETEDFAFWNLRRYLLTALMKQGFDLTLVTPPGPYVSRLMGLGLKHVNVSIKRYVSPLSDIKLFFDLYRVFSLEKPDIVHTMTSKPNTFGTMAAWAAGVPRIAALVCGAGPGFADRSGWKQKMLRFAVSRLYSLAGKITHRVWFLNPDDLAMFVNLGLISKDKTVLTLGEGVNVKYFSPDQVDPGAVDSLRAELGIAPSMQVVIMVARMIWSKGVKEFVEAAEIVSLAGIPAKFLIVGPLDSDSSDAVSETYLQSKNSPYLAYLGFRSDIRELMALADIVTLPSYYREGVPLVLLQALSMGKSIVTTDNVGCRETVDEGENGFLVPIHDSEAFALAVKKLLCDDKLRESFGRRSRAKAEEEFDESIVVDKVMTELYEIQP